jgi:hypothetical protein
MLLHRVSIAVFLLSFTASFQAQAQNTTVTVYKNAGCGCCEKWIEHLRAAGFDVQAHDAHNLDGIRSRLGVPPKLAGCHSAKVANYVVEGHVPADQIHRLLAEAPDVLGISVPGMPIGSPGMEGPGGSDYQVLSWRKDGKVQVFATVKPRER